MLSGEVIAIDFETTGLSPAVDRATEVAAVRLVGGSIVDRYQTLINAGIAVPPHVTALTGISTQMLHGAPSPGKVFRELRDFIGDLPVVAHHATFDNGFYRMELERAGIRSDPEAFLCTKLLSRRVLPGHSSYTLGLVAARLDVRFRSAAHRALADAEVCAHVLHALCGRIVRQGVARIDVSLLRRLIKHTPIADATKLLKQIAREQAGLQLRSSQTFR